MSFRVTFLSDSMWKRLDATFALYVDYTLYDGVHSVPGAQISKMTDLAEQFCRQSNLIVINCGINNLLNGYSVSNCMFAYDRAYKAIRSLCASAHVAFASLSYIADNIFTETDESHVINALVDEVNCELERYCDSNDKAHFIDLRECLSEDGSGITRSNLALDGLHYSNAGLMKVAFSLVERVEAVKSAIIQAPETSVLCSNISTHDENWPGLPAPERQARIHPASFPGQQFVNVYVGFRKEIASEKPVQSVQSSNRNSKLLRVKRCKQFVHSNATRNSYYHCAKSKLSVHSHSKKPYDKACKVNNNELVLRNKFTPLYCDEITDCDDCKHDADQYDELQCRSKVCCSVALRNKTKLSRKYCTSVPYRNTSHVKSKKTINVHNEMFTNPHRVSCFTRKSETDSRYSAKEFRRTVFVFDILPRFLDSLKLSVSEPLVQRLLLKYGIRTTNALNVTETMITLNNSDSLLNCALKLLLIKTQPCDATFLRVIHQSGNYLLKYNTLYGAYFMSSIDKNALSNICANKFDIDLLLLCGDVESNPGPPRKSRQRKQNTDNLKLVLPGCVPNVFTSNTLIDCFGSEYCIIKMPGSGFCGFHCLAHSLIGNSFSFRDIIHDCIDVFTNIPYLFRQRTNFGARSDASLTIGDYASFMGKAMERVQSRLPIDTDAWCEDSHFWAISLLYDVTICTFCVQSNDWHVFNELATRGYICLLNTPGHFDVLDSSRGPPVIPPAAHTHAVDRRKSHL